MMKTKGLRQVVLLLILTVFAGPASLGASSGSTHIPAWLAEFDDPPAWARPQMFFVWNGRLTTERISQMLRQYKREGIDKLLDAGDHELDVVVAGNLKNMMGPHFSDGLPGIWSWRWSGRRKQPPEKYNFAPCGLIKEPNLRIQP